MLLGQPFHKNSNYYYKRPDCHERSRASPKTYILKRICTYICTKDGKSQSNKTYLLWSVAFHFETIRHSLATGPRNQNNKWPKFSKRNQNEKRINQVALIVNNSSHLSTVSQALYVSFEKIHIRTWWHRHLLCVMLGYGLTNKTCILFHLIYCNRWVFLSFFLYSSSFFFSYCCSVFRFGALCRLLFSIVFRMTKYRSIKLLFLSHHHFFSFAHRFYFGLKRSVQCSVRFRFDSLVNEMESHLQIQYLWFGVATSVCVVFKKMLYHFRFGSHSMRIAKKSHCVKRFFFRLILHVAVSCLVSIESKINVWIEYHLQRDIIFVNRFQKLHNCH